MQKVLVTGAAGFIGSHVVEELTRRGISVRAAVLPGESTRNIDHLKPEIITGNILDKAFVERAIAGVDHVFHLAAVYSTWMPDWRPLWEVNLQGARNIFWACKHSDSVKRVVYTSSLSAIGIKPGREVSDEDTPFNQYTATPYVLSKYLSQQEALGFAQNGLDLVVVNPCFPFGPGDVAPTPTGNIILQMMKGLTRMKVDGGFNVVDVRDVALGHVLAAEKGRTGEKYLLGNQNMTGEEFVRLVGRCLGKEHAFLIPVPATAMKVAAFTAELVTENLLKDRRPPFTLGEIKYGTLHAFMSVDKARRELGYAPRDVGISLADSISWFREHGYAK
ncbi:MAG: NAD-dependent epimerase/dehydratase family protein [Gammaproteobacteria bacterium]